jgi:hypothetical protein
MNYLVGLLDKVSHLCPAHNKAYVAKDVLLDVLEGFEWIAAGQVTFELQDDVRLYRFKEFSVTLPHAEVI